jgi:thiopurine S-methyltransferase
MDQHFWTSRWEQNDIGFHKQEVHHALIRHHDRLNHQPGDSVLVPLCGKSVDMVWLYEHGFRVVGTEFSPIAVETFFDENNLKPARRTGTRFDHYTAKGVELLCGDHFALQRSDLNGALAVYDRAALVALPPDLRRRYATLLTLLLPPAARILLVSYDYNQDEISGPPFAVPQTEISDLFGSGFDIELLDRRDVLESHQTLKSRGVTKINEFTSLLTRRSGA